MAFTDQQHIEVDQVSTRTKDTAPTRGDLIVSKSDVATEGLDMLALGTTGHYLTSDGTDTVWTDLEDHDHTGDTGDGDTIDIISDDDNDTKMQVEKSADEDIIRFDAAGTEIMTVGNKGAVDVFHTAATANEHALEIDTDAAGFGDVISLDLVYDTGPLSTGEDEAVILISLNESDAGGGDVAAIEVLSTEGSANVFALEVGAVVHPIEHLSGTFANMDVALVNAVDRLTEFITSDPGGVNNVEIFSALNDTVTIGDANLFEEIEFLLETTASGAGIKPVFEFSAAGSTWTAFSPTDGTNGMRNTGVIAWLDSDIPAWVKHGSEYRIRITRTRTNLTTPPKEDKVQIAAVTIYGWDKNADLIVNDISAADITVSGTVDGVDIAARDHAKYTDAEAIAAVEGEATLALTGEVSIATNKNIIFAAETNAIGSPTTVLNDLYVDNIRSGTGDAIGITADGVLALIGAGLTLIIDGAQLYPAAGGAHLGHSSNKWGNLIMSGNISVDGTVDGVDIAARDHAKYLDSEAISAVEGEATLVLGGNVTIADARGIVVGHTSKITVGDHGGSTSIIPEAQVAGTSRADSTFLIAGFGSIGARANAAGPSLNFMKSLSGTIDSNGIVADGTILGSIEWAGDDGVDFKSAGAAIYVEVDGTPGVGDMPGRIVFATTSAGAQAPTERWEITATGILRSNGTQSIETSAGNLILNPSSNIDIGAKGIVTTTHRIDEENSSFLALRNRADTAYARIRLASVQIRTVTGLELEGGDGTAVRGRQANNGYSLITAWDTGVGNTEIARFAGAADPYFAMGGSQEFKFTNAGLMGLYGVAAAAQPAHIVDADGTLADITTKFNQLLADMATLGLQAAA